LDCDRLGVFLLNKYPHIPNGWGGRLSSSTGPNGANGTNGSGSNGTGVPRRALIIITAGLLTGLLLGALDQTIVATAGPTIISDLGGLSVYAWVFSAYILTQTVSMPIFGKLSDLYGRRKFLVLGIAIFMAGSVLSGAAQTIDQLIIFRAIQGIGSGAFFPIAIAVAGVIFPPSQRGRIQGVFASVFGVSAVLGPSVGSYLVQALSWRWIFYVNLPLGVASVLLIALGLKESRDANSNPKVDWLGVISLTAWITLLMLGFLSGGSTFAWYSWPEYDLFAGAAALFAVFIYAETRTSEPVVPLSLFRIRTVSAAAAVAFLTGIAMYAVITYVPLFVQAGLGGTIDDGRNILYAMMIPLVVGAIAGGQLATRSLGYRSIITTGLVVMSAGLYLLTTVGAATSIVQLMEYGAVMGVGIGLTFPVAILAIQYSVSRRQIGIASSLAQFTRNLGGTIGLSVLGAIQVNTFGSQLTSLLAQVPAQYRTQAAAFLGNPNLVGQVLSSPSALKAAEASNPAFAQFVPALRVAFSQSVSPLFLAGFGFAVASVVAGLFIQGSFKKQVAARELMHAKEDEEMRDAATASPDIIRSKTEEP
jgi:EmrB/QacA subfamily drug resistance transporter